MKTLTPAEIAEFDQVMADLGVDLDKWLESIRTVTAGVAERQALADVYDVLAREDPARVAMLLAVALLRMARGGAQ